MSISVSDLPDTRLKVMDSPKFDKEFNYQRKERQRKMRGPTVAGISEIGYRGFDLTPSWNKKASDAKSPTGPAPGYAGYIRGASLLAGRSYHRTVAKARTKSMKDLQMSETVPRSPQHGRKTKSSSPTGRPTSPLIHSGTMSLSRSPSRLRVSGYTGHVPQSKYMDLGSSYGGITGTICVNNRTQTAKDSRVVLNKSILHSRPLEGSGHVEPPRMNMKKYAPLGYTA